MDVADREGAVIHLVHVASNALPGLSAGVAGEEGQGKGRPSPENMMLQWKNSIQQATPHTVCTWMLYHSSIQQGIEDKAKELKPDLIVIGKNSNHSWFPFLNTVLIAELVESTGTAVLTVKPGSLHNKLKVLVVPVSGPFPKHKMEAIAALCRKNRLKVHLITYVNEDHMPAGFSAASLLKVYQWLKDMVHCPVEYAVVHGNNRARSVLQYAEKVNADILLVNPATETKLGWMNTHIPDILAPESKVQVLALHLPK